MNERVLTPRELNRALLARQLLLERSSLPLTRALEQVGGLQMHHPGMWGCGRGCATFNVTTSGERCSDGRWFRRP